MARSKCAQLSINDIILSFLSIADADDDDDDDAAITFNFYS